MPAVLGVSERTLGPIPVRAKVTASFGWVGHWVGWSLVGSALPPGRGAATWGTWGVSCMRPLAVLSL